MKLEATDRDVPLGDEFVFIIRTASITMFTTLTTVPFHDKIYVSGDVKVPPGAGIVITYNVWTDLLQCTLFYILDNVQ